MLRHRYGSSVSSARPPMNWGLFLGLLIVLAATIGVGYVAVGGVGEGYSVGERAGFVTKLSQKGLVWKTWEGELWSVDPKAGGAGVPVIWEFSVRADDPSVQEIQAALNGGQRVTLVYTQSLVQGWANGDSDYRITDVK